MSNDAFKLKGSITIESEEAVKQLDDIVAKGKDTAKAIERDTDDIQDSFKDGLDIPDDRFKKQTENIVKHTKNMADDVDTHASGIHGAIMNAFSFSAGQLITDGLKEAWQFLKDFSVDSVNAASSLDEVQNVVDVVFGEDSDKIDTWATSLKDAFGIGETKAKEFSGTLGAILDSMGLTNDEVLTMSTNLVELVGDMSSFYNLDHDTAFEKIRAGLTGETEPLKQIGINMSEANLEAYALSQGIDKAWESMTQAEQAGLRYNYMLDAMANASGDFSRTSDEYANQVRLLEENLTNVKEMFGDALIAILTPQLQGINKLLSDWLDEDPLDVIKEQAEQEIANAEWDHSVASKIIDDIEAMQEGMGEAAYGTDEWNIALDSLLQVMPELARYIDTTTGRLKVSTDELQKNADAVLEYKRLVATDNAISAYQQAKTDAENALIDNLIQQNIMKTGKSIKDEALADAAANMAEFFGMTDPTDYVAIDKAVGAAYSDWAYWGNDTFKALASEYNEKRGQVREVDEKIAALAEQEKELEETVTRATEEVAIAQQTREDYYSGLSDSIAMQEAYNQSLTDQQTALTNVGTAVNALKQHYDALKESARSSLDAIVGGFSKVEQLAPASVAEVKEALQSQHTLLVEYRDNLQEASTWGLDADLLAQLSDGSTDSMAILKMLAGNEEYRQEFNTEWLKNQQLADETAELMAQNQAAADEEFQKMKASVDEMVKDFNKREEARQAMLETGNGAIDAMDETIAALQAQAATVQGILASMFGGSISMSFTPTTGTPGQNAKGLGYVPYDNYLTYLHKGESVLSRTEAESWRKNAQDIGGSIDYDRLAAVLAAEMAGLTMQMDGQMIGALVAPTVSRNLEKEAWRGRY